MIGKWQFSNFLKIKKKAYIVQIIIQIIQWFGNFYNIYKIIKYKNNI